MLTIMKEIEDMLMETQTTELLKKCSEGCKMAVNSMEQVKPYVKDSHLKEVLDRYDCEYQRLDEETTGLLNAMGDEEKEPGAMASTFSWISTEVKLMLKDDSHQIAKIMMKGSNMGIQSMSESINKYMDASEKSRAVAKDIVSVGENFSGEMKQFL